MNWLDCGVASSIFPGETESGDRALVLPRPDGALVACIDGLGHGPQAADAAGIAIDAIRRCDPTDTALNLVSCCHAALAGTRGVVLGLGIFRPDAESMTWIGVGNVEGVLFRDSQSGRSPEHLLARGGIAGGVLPGLSASLFPLYDGDTLVMATDGVKADFAATARCDAAPQVIADRILARHGRGDDDALVVVARYRKPGFR